MYGHAYTVDIEEVRTSPLLCTGTLFPVNVRLSLVWVLNDNIPLGALGMELQTACSNACTSRYSSGDVYELVPSLRYCLFRSWLGKYAVRGSRRAALCDNAKISPRVNALQS